MQRGWYIVVGPAKTGTTVVARTLLNGVMPDGFSMEPASRQELEALRGAQRVAVKIILILGGTSSPISPPFARGMNRLAFRRRSA